MTHFDPCIVPDCKGCRWMEKNRKAIDARKAAAEAAKKPPLEGNLGPNLEAALMFAERYEASRGR